MSHAEKTLTLDEFLKLPETEPASEYVNGKVVQKVAPKAKHSWLQREFCKHVDAICEPDRLGMVFPELRCTFAGRSLVFDIAYFQWQRIQFDEDGEPADDVFEPPDWVVEILSPGQTVRNMTLRLTWCVRHGVRLAWLVSRRQQCVFVFPPDRERETVRGEDVLRVPDVLPGLRLTAAEIFRWLRPLPR